MTSCPCLFIFPFLFFSSSTFCLHLDIHLAQPATLDIEHETADLVLQFRAHEVALLENGDVVLDALFETVVVSSS